MRVLICGGRDFDDWRLLQSTLAQLHAERPFALVITGAANGADNLGSRWAHHQRIPVAEFPANWRFEGKAAGPKRNEAMIALGRPDLVVAFPGGRGTEDMVRRAAAAKVELIKVAPKTATAA